jgi:hypothetical protein
LRHRCSGPCSRPIQRPRSGAARRRSGGPGSRCSVTTMAPPRCRDGSCRPRRRPPPGRGSVPWRRPWRPPVRVAGWTCCAPRSSSACSSGRCPRSRPPTEGQRMRARTTAARRMRARTTAGRRVMARRTAGQGMRARTTAARATAARAAVIQPMGSG